MGTGGARGRHSRQLRHELGCRATAGVKEQIAKVVEGIYTETTTFLAAIQTALQAVGLSNCTVSATGIPSPNPVRVTIQADSQPVFFAVIGGSLLPLIGFTQPVSSVSGTVTGASEIYALS